jgi:hypothetical protein
MAIDPNLAGYASLAEDTNKAKGETTPETKEGVASEKLPELTLEMPDEDIIKLTKKWEKVWDTSPAKAKWTTQIDENEKYWLGEQFETLRTGKNRAMVDNLIFESVETYLPQATRRNPDPIVTVDTREKDEAGNEKPEHQKYILKVKNRLADIADKKVIRLKLKTAARHWAIYQLGVLKYGWDLDQDIPSVTAVRAKKIILDPESTINEEGYTGNRIGEHRKMEASKIIAIIGEGAGAEKIKELAKEDLSTEIGFKEWWTREYMCWTVGDTVLLKKKNPHWNYDQKIPKETVDDFGATIMTEEDQLGNNHFAVPEIPYSFLSIFNLGDQPMDKTGLINQNLANQDLINKRGKQIDKNADKTNGGVVISGERSGLTKDQSQGVTEAVRKGGAVYIPSGSAQEAIYFPQQQALPSTIYNQLLDTRARLRDIFGVKGSSQAGLEGEDTVRGKILSRGLDTDRIGGGVTEYLEQMADEMYNWFVQLLYVYDSGFQFIEGGVPPKIVVSVKEGSLLPKDSTSIANQAMELARMNKISNVDLYKRLEFPNPEELAANVWLETNAPHLLFKDNPMVQEAIMMQQQAAQAKTEADLAAKAQEQEGESNKMGMEHAQNMEMEQMKQMGKAEKGGDILKEVPVK